MTSGGKIVNKNYLCSLLVLAPDIGMGEHTQDQISSTLLSLGLEPRCVQNWKLLDGRAMLLGQG
jgi:hypothetical protein